jgi:hypothetical protein
MLDVAEKVTVVAPAPGAETTLEGRNCAVMPAGSPVTVMVTAELKLEFGVVVNVNVLDAPGATLMEVAATASVNAGAGATVSESDSVCPVDPLLAATVAE